MDRRASTPLVALAGASVGLLGGLIGLGGAEFRLPLFIGLFGFAALHAVILNKTMSLVVAATALPARLLTVPLADMAEHWDVAVNLLAGSLVGAWLGASWATRMQTRALHHVLAVLLVGIAVVLYASHQGEMTAIGLEGPALVAAGIAAGVGIGVVASVMGVAGSELLIPTVVLLPLERKARSNDRAFDVPGAGSRCPSDSLRFGRCAPSTSTRSTAC